jgi:hypothetical protein
MPPSSRQVKTIPTDDLIEIIDEAGRPLLVMPQRLAIRQNLRHKRILVCLCNPAGDIFLHPRGGLWDLAASAPVLAGESRYDAAQRCLDEALRIRGVELFETAKIIPPAPKDHVDVTLFLTAGTSAIPRTREGMFVDKEECQAMLRDFPHMVTPFLRLALPCLYP